MFLLIWLLYVGANTIQYPIVFSTIRSINLYTSPTTIIRYLDLESPSPTIFNVLSLEGWTATKGILGASLFWSTPSKYLVTKKFGQSDTQIRTSLKREYIRKGVQILAHAFSDNEFPLSLQLDPITTATSLSEFVINNNLDGVCIELMDQGGLNNLNNSQWILSFTKTLRTKLGSLIISYQQFPSDFVSGMAFVPIIKEFSRLVDFIVIKYYNQRQLDYTNYTTIFIQSSTYPGTSMKQLIQLGLLPNQLVVGKLQSMNVNSSISITGQLLQSAFSQAYNELGWYGGYASHDLYNDRNGTFASTAVQGLKGLCNVNSVCI